MASIELSMMGGSDCTREDYRKAAIVVVDMAVNAGDLDAIPELLEMIGYTDA